MMDEKNYLVSIDGRQVQTDPNIRIEEYLKSGRRFISYAWLEFERKGNKFKQV